MTPPAPPTPCRRPTPSPNPVPPVWSTAPCPNCGYPQADVDPAGLLWCPACGFSKKGGYT